MYSYIFLRLHRNQWNELTHATPLPLIAFVRPSTDNKNLLPSGSHCLRTLIIIIIFFLFFSRHVRKGHVCNEQQPISHINGDDTEQCEQRPSKYACTKARRYGFDSFSIQNVVQYPIDENLSSILISVSFFTMQNILNYRFFFLLPFPSIHFPNQRPHSRTALHIPFCTHRHRGCTKKS